MDPVKAHNSVSLTAVAGQATWSHAKKGVVHASAQEVINISETMRVVFGVAGQVPHARARDQLRKLGFLPRVSE